MIKYRSLGIIKNTGLPGFRYFEHAFLLWVHDILTTKCGLVQVGTNRKERTQKKNVPVGAGVETNSESSRGRSLILVNV